MVKKIGEKDHDSFYNYFQMGPERSDHVLFLLGPMLPTEIIAPIYSFH